AMHERDLRAEPGKDVRELDPDIARAEDRDPLRQLAQLERLVARDVRALRGPPWMPAGRDEHVFRGDALAFDLDRVRIGEPRAPADRPHASALEPRRIRLFQ